MASSSSSTTLFFSILVLTILATISIVEAQNVPDCAANLIPCAAYFNSTKPPDSCCKPLKDTITKRIDCLCNLYNNPGLIQSYGINITQGLQLPKHCGVSADLSLCTKASAPAPSIATIPKSPPVVMEKDNNGADIIAWSGVPALLFFWVSILAY